MAVSLNALFDIPTRDEKEKKRAQGQATVDRISEMNLADELTKGQLKYAKELGLEFTEKELDAIRERNVKALKTAGDATPEVTEARGKTSNLMTQANDWLEKNTGIRMGNPEAKAKVEANKARLDTQKFRNEATQAKAAEPFQGQLGTVSAQESISKSKLNEMTNVYGIDAAGDVAQTADLTTLIKVVSVRCRIRLDCWKPKGNKSISGKLQVIRCGLSFSRLDWLRRILDMVRIS
jgi:hypothetical protein